MVKAAIASATGKSITAVVSPKISVKSRFEAGVVLIDSRANAARNSMVITHRQVR
ncbi:hypothetical protein D3C87_1931600 [compost metagenome]